MLLPVQCLLNVTVMQVRSLTLNLRKLWFMEYVLSLSLHFVVVAENWSKKVTADIYN